MHVIHLRVLVHNCGTSDMLNLPIHVHLFVLSGLAFVYVVFSCSPCAWEFKGAARAIYLIHALW